MPSTERYLIRRAVVEDIPAIIELERGCASAAHWTELQYQQMFLSNEGPAARLVLVADASPESLVKAGEGTRLAGFLVAHHLAPEWELENIIVATSARRTGLGKRLLDALFDEAAETNSHAVFLEVRESNSAARALYEKSGFERTRRRKSYYSNPVEDAVLYRREVS